MEKNIGEVPMFYIRTFCGQSCQDQFCYNIRTPCGGLAVKCTRLAASAAKETLLKL